MTVRINRIIIGSGLRKEDDDMNSQILLTLEAARVNVKMTQEEAGKAIGVSANVISNWERGRTYPDAMQIKKIEKVYGVGYNNIIFLPN